MDVVFFCFTEKWWDWERFGFVGRTATLAARLARHPSVRRMLVVDAPTSVAARRLRSDERSAHVPVDGMPWLRRAEDGVYVLDQTRLLPRERHEATAFAVNGALHDPALLARLRRALAALEMRDPVSWLAGPTVARYALAPRLGSAVVYDAVDEWAAHPAYRSVRRLVLEGYDLIRREADLVFAVTPLLARRFTGGSPRVAVLPNAAEDARPPSSAEPADLAGIPHPRVGYVGALQDRLDAALVARVARAMPDAAFVFVGPVLDPRAVAPIADLPNVHLVGARPLEEVSAWLRGFDVCILPHRDTTLTRNMDPMKLYEYIAAGRPVVASALPGLTQPEELVARASSAEDWVARLRERLSAGPAAGPAAAYAASNTWDARIEAALEHIAGVRSAADAPIPEVAEERRGA